MFITKHLVILKKKSSLGDGARDFVTVFSKGREYGHYSWERERQEGRIAALISSAASCFLRDLVIVELHSVKGSTRSEKIAAAGLNQVL